MSYHKERCSPALPPDLPHSFCSMIKNITLLYLEHKAMFENRTVCPLLCESSSDDELNFCKGCDKDDCLEKGH